MKLFKMKRIYFLNILLCFHVVLFFLIIELLFYLDVLRN